MSKTFQEIEISNGSWIKEQSDQINIFNEKKLIEFSEDTFRLFDAMIFISYNASPLMHAMKFLKQSLNYEDYWEKSIDYIISEINFKEYNKKSKDGIESFLLLWNIIANKDSPSNEIRNQLILELINIIYDSEIDPNIDFLNDLNVSNLLGVLPDRNFKQIRLDIEQDNDYRINFVVLENIVADAQFKNPIKILGTKFSPIEHRMSILGLGQIFFKLKYKFSDSVHKIINSAKRYKISKLNSYISLLHIKLLKQNYSDWSKREFRNWLKASLVIVKIFDIILEKFLYNNIIYVISEEDKVDTKLGISNKNLNIIESIFNIDLSFRKNTLGNKSINHNFKNNLINKVFFIPNKNTLNNISKIKKLHEKIICAKFSAVSEYIFIIFIVQVLKKL